MNVHNLRKASGLSLEEFAKELQVHPRTVLRWETNKTFPVRNKLRYLHAMKARLKAELIERIKQNQKEHDESHNTKNK